MNVLLVVYDNESHISYFPMGTAYIASAIRNCGHHVEIYSQDIYHYDEMHLKRHIMENNIHVVGVGACGGYYQYNKVKKICAAINELLNPPVILLGGHLASPDPEYFLRKFSADFVIIGEGEASVTELLDAISNDTDYSEIKGIAYLDRDKMFFQTKRREPIKNVDEILMPAYDLFNIDHYSLHQYPNQTRTQRSMSILTGRGCLYRCNFCYRMDKGFRPRSAESILKEIHHLINEYNVTYFSFLDELFMSSEKRAVEVCTAFIDSNLGFSWGCSGRLNIASQKVLKLMKEAGCVFINYGIESVDDTALQNMQKDLTVAQIVSGIENTLDAGISPGYNIIFGNIGENEAVLNKGVDFLLKYDDHSQLRTIRPVTPYPGSPLFDIAVKNGAIGGVEDFYENKHTNSDLLTANFTDMSDEDFYAALYKANLRLLENYHKHIMEDCVNILDNLYTRKDTSFRGFRKI